MVLVAIGLSKFKLWAYIPGKEHLLISYENDKSEILLTKFSFSIWALFFGRN